MSLSLQDRRQTAGKKQMGFPKKPLHTDINNYNLYIKMLTRISAKRLVEVISKEDVT